MEDTLPLTPLTSPTTGTDAEPRPTGMTGGRFPSVELFATACLHLPTADADAVEGPDHE